MAGDGSRGIPPNLDTDEIKQTLELLQATTVRDVPKTAQEWKFWSTQPVPDLTEDTSVSGIDGEAIKPDQPISELRQVPFKLPNGFEWSTLDLEKPSDLKELYMLLNENYVEDDDAMFRFDYTPEFLRWALLPPGFNKDWHVGIRVSNNYKLVSFISGTLANLRIGTACKNVAEINFLCVHKEMRSKRVAPVLIKEITRRVNMTGIFQAVYTAGVHLPKPVCKVRYYHRSINIKKLLDVKFTALGIRQTVNMLKKLYKLPEQTFIPGFRKFAEADVPQVLVLLNNYLEKNMSLAPHFNSDDLKHWLLPRDKVVSCYVVEDPDTKKITDMASFYSLPSTVMTTPKYKNLYACYSFYNVASEKTGWVRLMKDMLISAKREGFDVYNALECMENPKFLEELKFGSGDGELHYYLFNWKIKDITKDKLGLVLL